MTLTRQQWWALGLGLIVLSIVGLYALLVNPEVIGLIRDDGIYTAVAQSLARGEGFRLPHVPGTPYQVRYPLFYPLCLSLGWLIEPRFPQVMPWLAGITLFWTALALPMVYLVARRWFRLPRWLALCAILLTAGNYYYYFGATSLMSEPAYLALSLLTLLLAERHTRKPSTGNLVALMVASILAFHTRTLGVMLLPAVALGLWVGGQRRQALIYGGTTGLMTIVVWMAWVGLHSPAEPSVTEYILYHAYSSYSQTFKYEFTPIQYLKTLPNSVGETLYSLLQIQMSPAANALTYLGQPLDLANKPILVRTIATGTLVSSYGLLLVYLLPLLSHVRRAWTERSLSRWTVPALYVGGYVLLCWVWNYQNQMARFFSVVTPILSMWLLRWAWISCKKAAWVRATLVGLILLGGLSHTPVAAPSLWLFRKQSWMENGKQPTLWQDYQATYQYLRTHTQPNDLLATAFELTAYFHTGRPSINLFLTNYPVAFNQGGKIPVHTLADSTDNRNKG